MRKAYKVRRAPNQVIIEWSIWRVYFKSVENDIFDNKYEGIL